MVFAGCEHYLRQRFHNNMKTNARALPKLISFPRVLDDMFIVGLHTEYAAGV